MFPTNNEARVNAQSNRPFYLYGGYIEIIRFKEYYGMPGGMCTIRYTRSVFTRVFRGNFSFTCYYFPIIAIQKEPGIRMTVNWSSKFKMI